MPLFTQDQQFPINAQRGFEFVVHPCDDALGDLGALYLRGARSAIIRQSKKLYLLNLYIRGA